MPAITNDESPREQVAWNIAGAQAKHISNLIEKATASYLTGNLGRWYWTLSALREMINYDLEDTEIEILDDIEKNCNKYHNQWEAWKKSFEEGQENKKLRDAKNAFSIHVRKYQRKIMKLLKELGYFPNKEDRTELGF
jgi:hypothetical protein